ncbi:hypothetical protein HCN44_001925 [Aphidius gifuensis]|uniref:Kielin/chordin-like protein n=1 Tax=Aphidius gifuensis TaxID=684658 RepID=A0A834Y234_APHGI|nr:uncharacterized protein LOC122861172 [Aphidius gifuensis]KAF7996293.1 hypothetical protein HCN44_001925 [Aphidius gifuensis]
MIRQWNFYLGVFFLAAHVACSVDSDCDKTKCLGPLMHYKALGCKPIYLKTDDCCPYKYDCDHLKNRSDDKCYVNGHEYNIGEALKDEDRSPCDHCTCVLRNNVALFTCAAYSCPYPDAGDNCYVRQNATSCCPDYEAICPKSLEERPTCDVNGKVYLDGEYFEADGLECYCGPNYQGKNIEPFCRKPKQVPCSLDVHYSYDVRNNCPPVYYDGQNPQTSCAINFRCANDRDEIVKHGKNENVSDDKNSEDDEFNVKCIFGNMTLRVGDSLKSATDYSSVCVDCTCEIPPMVTCRQLPEDKCDPTKHEDFNAHRL